FAEAMTNPRSDVSVSAKSRCSLSSSSAASSKIFAPDSGRSKVSTQILSSETSRRIIGAVATAGIEFILTIFQQIPSGEAGNARRCQAAFDKHGDRAPWLRSLVAYAMREC